MLSTYGQANVHKTDWLPLPSRSAQTKIQSLHPPQIERIQHHLAKEQSTNEKKGHAIVAEHTARYGEFKKRMAVIYKQGKAIRMRAPKLKEACSRRCEELILQMRERSKNVKLTCSGEVRI